MAVFGKCARSFGYLSGIPCMQLQSEFVAIILLRFLPAASICRSGATLL